MIKVEKKEFEFYEFMEQLKKDEEMREIDRKLLEAASSKKNRRCFEEQRKNVSKRKKTSTSYRIKAGAMTFIMAISFSVGIGVKTAYDQVAPIVKTYVQNSADDFILAGSFEDFERSKDGYYLEMQIKKVSSDSIFSDGPMPYDYDDLDNLSVNEYGQKVGAIVDYYDGFDSYLKSSKGIGYYETIYNQMQRLVSIGKDPNSIESLYTYEELTDMLNKDVDKGLGVN